MSTTLSGPSTDGSATAPRTYADSARSPIARLLGTRDAAVLGLLLAVVVYAVAVVPNFDAS